MNHCSPLFQGNTEATGMDRLEGRVLVLLCVIGNKPSPPKKGNKLPHKLRHLIGKKGLGKKAVKKGMEINEFMREECCKY